MSLEMNTGMGDNGLLGLTSKYRAVLQQPLTSRVVLEKASVMVV